MSDKSDLVCELNLKLKESEAAFNEYRDQLIKQAIENSLCPEKMKQLQWRIDGVILRSTNHGAMIKLSKMMNDSFLELNETLNMYR